MLKNLDRKKLAAAVATHRERLLGYAVVLFLFLLYGWLLAHKLDITRADLGRHLRSGELFFQNGQILGTNFYSYTHADFPIMYRHHWGAGALFYLFWQYTGFVGLHLFFTALTLLTFALFFSLALKKSSLALSSLVAILIIPFLMQRTEIRPEVFSYLCYGIFFRLLLKVREDQRWAKTALCALPLLEMVWVNLHIMFFLGPAIVGLFCFESLFLNRERTRTFMLLLVLTLLAMLINPLGLEGVLVPFKVMDNLGFKVAENLPVWNFGNGFYNNPVYSYFEAFSLAFAVSAIVAGFKQKKKLSISYLLLALFVSASGWAAIRNFPMFGLFALAILPANLSIIGGALPKVKEWKLRGGVLVLLSVIALVLYAGGLDKLLSIRTASGFGLEPENSAAIEFFNQNELHGPIFNNFNIGGYLIFHLYPREKVFIDNRPEAYPASFFQQEYLPMLSDESKWKELENRYGFRTIILDHTDMSPAIMQFKISRMSDPEWKLVFLNNNVVIFTRNAAPLR